MKRTITQLFFLLCLVAGVSPVFGQTYCTTGLYSISCTSGDFIQSFSTTGGSTNITNNNTGCSNTVSNYTYFSAMTHSGIQGTAVNFSFTNNPTYTQGYKIWVDYNGNGSFADPG